MSVAFLRNVPVEVLEAEAPVVVHRFSLTPDSEGPGKFRGGFGVEYELEIRHPSAVVVMRGKDRQRFSVLGRRRAAAPARPAAMIGTRPGAAPHDIGKRTVYRAELGEVIRLWGGGGGGFGDPFDARPARGRSRCRGRARLARAGARGLRRGARTATRSTRRRRGRCAPASGQAARFRFRRGAPGVGTRSRRGGGAHRRLAAGPAGRRAPLCPSRNLPPAARSAGPGPYRAEAIEAAIAAVGAALGRPPERLAQAAE